MTSAKRLLMLMIRCPTCGRVGPGPEFITEDWNGTDYEFVCGHRAHLDKDKGGAETWLRPVKTA